ncbi:PEGA domain-containing protein [Pontiella sp.]|uniref:PEGA domain-containing protein n=1 Tax=Pontiella sp. TaxID=2837462 RepID=UPI00356AB03F
MKRSFAIALMGLAPLLLLTGCEIEMAGKGAISINSDPKGAEVFVNGTSQGTAPQTLSGLMPGNYIIELRKEGFERSYKSVSLLEGQEMDVTLNLKPITGLLLVDSNPQNADVIIDGISKGNTPLLLTDLPLGEYTIEFRSPKQLPRTMKTTVEDRTPVRVFAELVSNTAQLDVTSQPDGAEVRINGIYAGDTPIRIEEVQAGEADVKVSKRGYKSYQARMTFEATKPYKIDAELEALPSGLTVMTTPEGAKIFVDNKVVGESPITLENLNEGPHEVRAMLDGYDTATKNIYLEPDINDSVDFTLAKNSGTLVIDTEPANVQIYVDGKFLTTTQPKGGSDSLSQPVRITLKSGNDHTVQLVREGFVSRTTSVQVEVDQIVTRHEVLKRIFVYDTQITTESEIIKCRMEYRLPNGNIYYERYPGVFDTARAADIRDVQPITLDDESNREARRLIEMNTSAVPAP